MVQLVYALSLAAVKARRHHRVHAITFAVAGDVGKIMEHILRGAGRNKTFDRLALLGDTFGHRLSGSQSLEDAIGRLRVHTILFSVHKKFCFHFCSQEK